MMSQEAWITLMNPVQALFILYYFVINTGYLVLLVAAFLSIRRQRQTQPLIDSLRKKFPSFAPAISVLAPAYNEQQTIVDSTKSFLMLNYPSFEVIVINDGSKDGTFEELRKAFRLAPTEIPCDRRLSSGVIRGIYRSKLHENLVVIDKENGGKADALNVGIEYSQYTIFCAVDSDSILEEDALLQVSLPFLEDPARVIASGGTIRIANGADVRFGRVQKVELPNNFYLLMQVVEYTRAFLCGRMGWNAFNATLVISGAFGLFSKKAVMEVGGYKVGSIGEDMELVVRLHRHFRERRREYSIVFVPNPVCWTEAPASFDALQKQRDRWQRGLADTLMQNRDMLFNPKFGMIGFFAFPYFLMAELVGPLIELVSFAFILILYSAGLLSPYFMFVYLAIGVLYSAMLSIAAFVIEEVYFCKYVRAGQFLLLFALTLLESFGYRQITSLWRLRGFISYIRGDHSWGHLKRVGFNGPDVK